MEPPDEALCLLLIDKGALRVRIHEAVQVLQQAVDADAAEVTVAAAVGEAVPPAEAAPVVGVGAAAAA